MADFLKQFLLEDPRRLSSNGRFAALAAFGKHPGWDDHIEDLGLETESLNLAKTTLYVNGIGGQIDSGAWEKLDPAQRLPGFNHMFAWQRSDQVLLGRLWTSSDGKGRKRYPMVICLHFGGVNLGWALKAGLPLLAELERGCTGTQSAQEVRSLLGLKRATARQALAAFDTTADRAGLAPEQLREIIGPLAGTAPERLLRVVYQVHSQFAGFASGSFSRRSSSAAGGVQQIRVPVLAGTPELALLFWTRFFLVFVDPAVPLLMTLPLDGNLIDITAGEPESREFFCLQASPKAVPVVSEIPYNLDENFRANALSFLKAFQQGATVRPDLGSAISTARGKGGVLKWLGLGLVLLLCALGAYLVASQRLKMK